MLRPIAAFSDNQQGFLKERQALAGVGAGTCACALCLKPDQGNRSVYYCSRDAGTAPAGINDKVFRLPAYRMGRWMNQVHFNRPAVYRPTPQHSCGSQGNWQLPLTLGEGITSGWLYVST